MLKIYPTALAGWISWFEHCPMHQKVAGSIPGQGTLPKVVGSISSRGMCRKQWIDVCLSHCCFSFSPFFSLKSINVSSGEDFFLKKIYLQVLCSLILILHFSHFNHFTHKIPKGTSSIQSLRSVSLSLLPMITNLSS